MVAKKSVLQQLVEAGLTQEQIEGLGKYKRFQDDQSGREAMLRGAAGRRIGGGHSLPGSTVTGTPGSKYSGGAVVKQNSGGGNPLKPAGDVIHNIFKSRKPKADKVKIDKYGHRVQ